MAKLFQIQTLTGDPVMGGPVSLDNAYISTYGKIVRGGAAPTDLLVDEFTFKEFALSGQAPTTYVIVRVE